jgi:outer membrane protein OmpA-like peptidoglycan-associated protein
VKRFSAALKADDAVIRLEVMGHTDTVGSSASNAALSDRRANAIARWFAKRKLTVQIWARGAGEDMLKVETPDETDEPRNRRVDYHVYPSPKNAGNSGWARVN